MPCCAEPRASRATSTVFLTREAERRQSPGRVDEPPHLRPEVRARIARNGDVLQGRRPAQVEARAGRQRRKARPVLDAIQPLFLDRGDQVAVFQQRADASPWNAFSPRNLHPRRLLVDHRINKEPEPEALEKVKNQSFSRIKEAQPEDVPISPVRESSA